MREQRHNVKETELLLSLAFNDPKLLATALTHSSAVYEGDYHSDSERLEFLGDSVLGLIITERIYKRFPHLAEGDLAKMRANLVRAETLATVAARLGLGKFIFMSRGTQQAGGRHNESILSDCLEAVIGAAYLDQGFGVATGLVNSLFTDEIIDDIATHRLADAKTTLQELTMARWSVLPKYEVKKCSGPAHSPLFEAAVMVNDQVVGVGSGTSKKRAQQIAAGEALAALEQ